MRPITLLLVATLCVCVCDFDPVFSVVMLCFWVLAHGFSRVRGVNLGGWLVVEGWIKPSLFDGIPNGDMLVCYELELFLVFTNVTRSNWIIYIYIYF